MIKDNEKILIELAEKIDYTSYHIQDNELQLLDNEYNVIYVEDLEE